MKVAQLTPLIDDAELERQIDRAQKELESCPVDERREKWERFRDLIQSRSPAQVERMERQKGLR